jgi:hypothetical protein
VFGQICAKEIGLRHHVRPVCEQNSQQIERLWRQVHFHLPRASRASYELPRFGIEHEVTESAPSRPAPDLEFLG